MSSKKKVVERITNKKFSTDDDFFKKACEKAGVEATTRQASKFRNNRGLAFKHRKQVKEG
jgi:hypothetical protein